MDIEMSLEKTNLHWINLTQRNIDWLSCFENRSFTNLCLVYNPYKGNFRRNQPNHKTLKSWILLIFSVQVRPRKLFTDLESFCFRTNILDFMAVWNFRNFWKFWEFCNVWKVITLILFLEKRWSWCQSTSFNLKNLMEQQKFLKKVNMMVFLLMRGHFGHP